LGQTRNPGGKDSQPSNTESQKRIGEKKVAEVKVGAKVLRNFEGSF